MKRSGKTLALALSALTVSNGAFALTADSSASPYRGIVERNVFDVHDAPPPKPVEPISLLPPPPNIRLQGITDILGHKQVLFKVQLPPKPGAPAKEESYILAVGERQGEIEVLAIDVNAGTVQMKNYGVITNLSLELNSDKLVNVAPVTGPATQPNPAGMTAPGAIAPPPSLPTLPAGKFPRTLRLPGQANNAPNPFGGSGTSYGGASAPAHELTSDEAAVVLSANKLKAMQEGSPMHKIMPVPPGLMKEFQNIEDPPAPTPAPQ